MALRLSALHDALLDAGADPALAQKAVEELADYRRSLQAWPVAGLTILQIVVATLLLILAVYQWIQ